MGNPKIKSFFLPLASLLLICACTMQPDGSTLEPTSPITDTAPIPFAAIVPLSSSTPIVVSATATVVWTDAAKLMPTIPYTPTSSIPVVTVSVGTNCREGPGIIYNLLDGLMVGEQAQIVKLAPAGVDYVVIQRPHGPGECWLWLQYATITGDTGQLPLAIIPPTPTPTATATSTFTLTPTSTDTVAPPSPFEGVWKMVVFGDPHPYQVTLVQTGSSITGTFTAGTTFTLTGIVNADGKTVNGDFAETQGVHGTFTWYLLPNMVQFTGRGDLPGGVSLPWCGYREGQSAPIPCQAP